MCVFRMLCHSVQSIGEKTHTSQSLIEECLTGSSNRKDSFVEMSGKKMKNGLNGFQTFTNLLLIYFHINKNKVCILSLLLLALKHCVTMEMGIFCPPRTVRHQNCLYRAADWRHSKIGRHKRRERIRRIKQILSASASEAPRFKSCLYEMEYIWIYIYTYNIQLRFNFKAIVNLFIL